MSTAYEAEVRYAEKVASTKRERGLTWNEAVEFLRKARPSGPGTYAKLGDIKRALQVEEPKEPAYRLLRGTRLSPEDAEIAAGVAIKAVMAGLTDSYSTPEMMQNARGKPCPYCWTTMLRHGNNRASRDHLVAKVNGGKLSKGNVLIVCQECNCDKGTRSLHAWLAFLRTKGDTRVPIVEALINDLKKLGRVAERPIAPALNTGEPATVP